jgi:hypothetical protein
MNLQHGWNFLVSMQPINTAVRNKSYLCVCVCVCACVCVRGIKIFKNIFLAPLGDILSIMIRLYENNDAV